MNPLFSLADDVAATKRAIAMQDGPVILVGHSWAGVVISEAGNDPKVAGLVYVAAIVPDEGQSTDDVLKPYPPPAGLAEAKPDSAGFLSLTRKGIDEDFVQMFRQPKEPLSTQPRVRGIRHASPLRCRSRHGRQNRRGSSGSCPASGVAGKYRAVNQSGSGQSERGFPDDSRRLDEGLSRRIVPSSDPICESSS
jgi:pimeloyl-ACP methyl ester carboxylesterase